MLRFGISRFAQSGADWLDKARHAEQRGFDVLWAPDHLFHFQKPDEPVLDGWMTLAAWAATTTKIRLGSLVTNLSWRPPVLVARMAAALDQLSGGRLELGLGAGAFADQAMVNALAMSGAERVARLSEGAEVIDRLLRGDISSFSGRFTSYEKASMAPGCVQAPRPPVTIAANGDRALRVAARYADTWNTWGGFEIPVDEFVSATETRCRRLDDHCSDLNRDPATLRRSLLLYPRFIDPWASAGAAEEVIERFSALGFTEFIFYWPADEQLDVFDRFAGEVMPQLRGPNTG